MPCRLYGCEKCCYETRMPLTRSDMERLENLGYSRDYFAICDDAECRLRNIEGHCVFLEPGEGCRIYPQRPLGCRIYPVICVEGEGLAVDAYCPIAHLALHLLEARQDLVKRIALVITREYGVPCPARIVGIVHTG
ncbi:YkgJ family cysteine cluster protein [Pyrolobus fumarii]|nr:YkgJ family cysteine cluster protein [Pyrolobus fumarii]